MPLYTVEGANKKTGDSITLDLQAPSVGAAKAEAHRQGYLTSDVYEVQPDAHQLASDIRELKTLLSQQQNDIAAIRNTRLVKAPIGTITTAVICAFLFAAIFTFSVGTAYFGLQSAKTGR